MSFLVRGLSLLRVQISRSLVALSVGGAAAVALSGCGLGVQPLAGHGGTTTTSSSAAAVAAPEPVTSSASGRRAAHSPASAVQAVRRFAKVYVDWRAGDVEAHLRTLARSSVGQARSAMTLEAVQTRVDRRLRSGSIGNRGVIESVAPLAGSSDRYVVVTRERTLVSGTAYQSLPPAWHVTVATVARARVRGSGRLGWVVSGWQPES